MSSTKEKKASQRLLETANYSLDDLLGGNKAAGLDALAKGVKADAADPIGAIDYANLTNEEATGREISDVLAAFKQRAKTEQERFEAATDSEFWLGVCFQTRAQKEAFLQGVNMLQHGDKYIDGEILAKRMGIALPAADVPYNVSAKPDKKLAELVLKENS